MSLFLPLEGGTNKQTNKHTETYKHGHRIYRLNGSKCQLSESMEFLLENPKITYLLKMPLNISGNPRKFCFDFFCNTVPHLLLTILLLVCLNLFNIFCLRKRGLIKMFTKDKNLFYPTQFITHYLDGRDPVTYVHLSFVFLCHRLYS